MLLPAYYTDESVLGAVYFYTTLKLCSDGGAGHATVADDVGKWANDGVWVGSRNAVSREIETLLNAGQLIVFDIMGYMSEYRIDATWHWKGLLTMP